jgi:hypothetical protein
MTLNVLLQLITVLELSAIAVVLGVLIGRAASSSSMVTIPVKVREDR